MLAIKIENQPYEESEKESQISYPSYKDEVVKHLEEAKRVLEEKANENSTNVVSYIDMAIKELLGEVKEKKVGIDELPEKDEENLIDKLTK